MENIRPSKFLFSHFFYYLINDGIALNDSELNLNYDHSIITEFSAQKRHHLWKCNLNFSLMTDTV